MEFDAVAFDVDGVLVDSEEVHWETFKRAVFDVTSFITPEYLREEFSSLSSDQRLLKLQMHGLEISQDQIVEIKTRKFSYVGNITDSMKLNPYAKRVIGRLRAEGKKVSMVSNARTQYVCDVARALDVEVDVTVGNDMGLEPKPSPSMYLYASANMSSATSRTVVIEDSITGVNAAIASGCPYVHLSDLYQIVKNKFYDFSDYIER